MQNVESERTEKNQVRKHSKNPRGGMGKSLIGNLLTKWKLSERRVVGALGSSLLEGLKGAAGLGLSALVVGTSVLVAAALLLHVMRPEHMIIVQPFEIQQETFKNLGLTSKSASDLVTDEFNTDVNNASAFRGFNSSEVVSSQQQSTSTAANSTGKSTPSHYGSVRKLLKIPIQSSFGIEVNGISLDTLLQAYDRIRYETWDIRGDLTGTEQFPAVSIRLTKKDASTQWYYPLKGSPKDREALTQLLRSAADQLLESWDPEIMTRAYLQEGRFEDSERVARAWLEADPSNNDPAYYLILSRFFEGLRCEKFGCGTSDDSGLAYVHYEEALSFATQERGRLGKPDFLSRFRISQQRAIAYDPRDRLEDIIAAMELTVCANSTRANCSSYQQDAERKYSSLAKRYKNDENIVVNLAMAELRVNEAKKALDVLDAFERDYPVNAAFFLRKGLVEENLGDNQGEINAFRSALQADPSNRNAQVAFLDILADRGNSADLSEIIQTFLWLSARAPLDEQTRESVDLRIRYALALAKTGDVGKATGILKSIVGRIGVPGVIKDAEVIRAGKHPSEALQVVQAKIAQSKDPSPQEALSLFEEASNLEKELNHGPEAALFLQKAASAKAKIGKTAVQNIVVHETTPVSN